MIGAGPGWPANRERMKVKTVVRTKVTGVAESHSLTLLKVRDLVDVSDEPPERGGTNEGFAPTEMFLGSLAACTNVITHKIAKKHGIPVDGLNIVVDSEFNRLGVTLQEEVKVPFPQLRLEIRIATSADDTQLEILKQELRMYCPVSRMIEQAGTKLDTQWIVE